MQIHKQKEYKIISKKANKEKQNTISNKESMNSIIIAEDNEHSNEFSTIENSVTKRLEIEDESPERDNEISTIEKSVTERLKIEGENPERDKKTIKKQDKTRNKESNNEKHKIFTNKELTPNKNDKKVINGKIITEKNDIINKTSTTGKSLTNIKEFEEQNLERGKKNRVKQKFEWINLKEIKKFSKYHFRKRDQKGQDI